MDQDKYKQAYNIAKAKFVLIRDNAPASLIKREQEIFNKVIKNKFSELRKIGLLFKEMDIIYEYVSNYSICKRGCCHCCYYPITISPLEVEFIKKHTKIKRLINTSNKNACPFLTKGSCSIYEYRPFLCRRHLSINDVPKWCEKDICNNFEFPQIQFTEIDKCYDYLVSNQLNLIKDIRDVF